MILFWILLSIPEADVLWPFLKSGLVLKWRKMGSLNGDKWGLCCLSFSKGDSELLHSLICLVSLTYLAS